MSCGDRVLAEARRHLEARRLADRLHAGDGLQAAARPAGAGEAARLDGDVAELAREAACAPVQLLADDDAAADADLARDVHEAVEALARRRPRALRAPTGWPRSRRPRHGRAGRAAAASSSAIGTRVQPRFGARRRVPLATSTRPGTATPTPTTRSPSARARCRTSSTSTPRRCRAGAGEDWRRSTCSAASRRTAPVRSSRQTARRSTLISAPTATVARAERDRRGGAADARSGARRRGSSRTRPRSTSSATRLDTVDLLSPVSEASAARDSGRRRSGAAR